jgi:hypothetical protein
MRGGSEREFSEKLNDRTLNVYEKKGPMRETPAKSVNVYENKRA